MKFFLSYAILLQIFFTSNLFAQDLLKERIRKLSGNKTSIYVENGIFHNGHVKGTAVLKSVRQSFNIKQKFERIVLDFNSTQIPKVYGHISSKDLRLYIDLFDTTLAGDLKAVVNTRYVEKINFFPIEKNHLSVEIKLKARVTADIFSLDNPGRLVIDLKN